jgi:hypothetical protein
MARREQPARQAREERPEPDWVRGICPCCGEELVANCYYVSGRGYLTIWECWASLAPQPACEYRRVL